MAAESPASVRRGGIFDRSAKGRSTQSVKVEVERGRIRVFALALGETDPIHFDVEAARKKGHPDLVAPPSFFTVLEALANEELARRGQPTGAEMVGCDFRYLLHGNEHYTYEGLVYAGDELDLTTTVVDFYEKSGGALEFATFSTLVTHPERGVLIRGTRTLLHRLG